jgi:hypothetical protein
LDEVKKLLEEILSSADKRLSPHAENLVKISYKRSLRSTTDPYKRAVFCVLAACDPRDEHSEVATNLDMYLWLKLLQLRERGKKKNRLSLVKVKIIYQVKLNHTQIRLLSRIYITTIKTSVEC